VLYLPRKVKEGKARIRVNKRLAAKKKLNKARAKKEREKLCL
jgi:hypothetical protein